MVDTGFTWIYLIFFLIPLARILPRLIKKWKLKYSGSTPSSLSENKFQVTNNTMGDSTKEPFRVQSTVEPKPRSIDMLVLGELNHGTKNFDIIQKKLGIDNKTLDSVLEDLENQGLMRVEQKNGLFGPKIELHPTEEGLKKYYS